MCEKMIQTQNHFGSILNPSTLKGLGADPMGAGTSTQKSKHALFKTDKASLVKKGSGTEPFRKHSKPFGSERSWC